MQTRSNVSRLILSNRNSIRYDLSQGPYTLDDAYIVCPWVDYMKYVKDVSFDDASKLFGTLEYYAKHQKCPNSLPSSAGYGSETASQKILARRDIQPVGMLSPGYTTLDDFGVGGDDSQHSQIPYYEPPAYVQANVTVAATENKLSTPYDIVFIDHLEQYVKPALDCINKNKYQVEAEYYVNKEINTNTLLGLYAQKYWTKPLENCTVAGFVG